MHIPIITTENLRLRPFTPEDATTMHTIINGKDVLQYFPGSQSLTEEQVQKMITRINTGWQEKGYGLWAVELRPTNTLLGRCGLQYISETDEVEIDFILDKAYWGRGFATEAGQASLGYGLDDLQLSEIIGIVHPENLASQRVLQKLGMRFAERTTYFGMACFRYVAQRP